MLPITDLSDPN
uniref:Uncharacterized protein n=1 Tax=Anguilla anguilla TaxID=7936 RepID=A0A0E9T469_ANGAN